MLFIALSLALAQKPIELHQHFGWRTSSWNIEVLGSRRESQCWSVAPERVRFWVTGGTTGDTLPRFSISSGQQAVDSRPHLGTWQWRRAVRFDRCGAAAGRYQVFADVERAIDSKAEIQIGPGIPAQFFLAPETETELAAIRRKWVGKKVWPLGSAGLGKGDAYLWDPRIPAIVKSVHNADGWQDVGSVSSWNLFRNWAMPSMTTYRPLVVEMEATNAVPSSRFPDTPFTEVPSYKGGATCRVSVFAASEAQMEMLLLTKSPQPLLQRTSGSIRRAFVQRRIIEGMPIGLVVRLIGYPRYDEPELGDYLLAERSWSFQGGIDEYIVQFDVNGRVDRCGQILGKLP
jgi:hypothetical protein